MADGEGVSRRPPRWSQVSAVEVGGAGTSCQRGYGRAGCVDNGWTKGSTARQREAPAGPKDEVGGGWHHVGKKGSHALP